MNNLLKENVGRTKAKPNLVCGLTLIEILIAVSVLIVISAVIFGTFRSFDEKEALSRDTENVISILEKARSQTLFSKDSSRYGVRFNTDEAILFKGEFYSISNPENTSTKLHSKVLISEINLPNSTTSISFKRLSGETDQNGTIVLQNRTDALKTKTITIEGTGLVE